MRQHLRMLSGGECVEGGRRGDTLETPTRKGQVEEEPVKEAWREEPEQLLRLASEKLRKVAGFGPRLGHIQKATDGCFSLSPPSLSRTNKNIIVKHNNINSIHLNFVTKYNNTDFLEQSKSLGVR